MHRKKAPNPRVLQRECWRRGDLQAKQMSGCSWGRRGTAQCSGSFRKGQSRQVVERKVRKHTGCFSCSPNSTVPPSTVQKATHCLLKKQFPSKGPLFPHLYKGADQTFIFVPKVICPFIHFLLTKRAECVFCAGTAPDVTVSGEQDWRSLPSWKLSGRT